MLVKVSFKITGVNGYVEKSVKYLNVPGLFNEKAVMNFEHLKERLEKWKNEASSWDTREYILSVPTEEEIALYNEYATTSVRYKEKKDSLFKQLQATCEF